jgi:hypothetical protein
MAISNILLCYEILNYDCMDAEDRAKQDARAENNESYYFMKTAMDGGNVVNAGAINYLELCHFSTC